MGGIGAGATMFSAKRGAEGGLDRLTWIVILLFMAVCMVLGFGIVK
jgi:protein translocase SecG subunit